MLAKKHKDCNILIQWLPAHVGIQGNETADSLAGDCNHTNTINNIQIPPEDAKTICRNLIHNKWKIDYTRQTQKKGKISCTNFRKPNHKAMVF